MIEIRTGDGQTSITLAAKLEVPPDYSTMPSLTSTATNYFSSSPAAVMKVPSQKLFRIVTSVSSRKSRQNIQQSPHSQASQPLFLIYTSVWEIFNDPLTHKHRSHYFSSTPAAAHSQASQPLFLIDTSGSHESAVATIISHRHQRQLTKVLPEYSAIPSLTSIAAIISHRHQRIKL